MSIRKGKSTILLENRPTVRGFASIGAQMEGEGPLGKNFDLIIPDGYFGESSWEKAESKLQKTAVQTAMDKAKLQPTDIDVLFAGDLLNQCIGSTYGLREFNIPFVGLYGACSTMAEGLMMSSLFLEAGYSNYTCAVTSSHFCSAERQFRFPLEYGSQRPPSAQWTATASGAVVMGTSQNTSTCMFQHETYTSPVIKAVTIGTIVDLGITDANNMGAAMAPAAANTIKQHLQDTGCSPDQFDMIVTGDLGTVGSDLLLQLLQKEGIDIKTQHSDCGTLLYDCQKQQVDSGGSGCGCSASVLCSHLLPKLCRGEIKNLLFMSTGALMSTTAVQQGESIPGIAHLVHIQGGQV